MRERSSVRKLNSDLIKKDHSVYNETADIETSSEDYARRFSGKIGEYFLEVQAKITLDLLKPFPKASVLDVGGGHAHLAGPLIHNGFNVTVVGSADICRKRLDRILKPGSFRYLTCNLLHLPFEDLQFDAVLAFRLLSHVNQWKQLIAEMCRVAKNAIIVDYPDLRSFNIMYKFLFHAKKRFEGNTRPFSIFTRKQLVSEFDKRHFGLPDFRPQFFLPMVFYRALRSVLITHTLESINRTLCLTSLFGSPVILRLIRLKQGHHAVH